MGGAVHDRREAVRLWDFFERALWAAWGVGVIAWLAIMWFLLLPLWGLR